MENKVAVFFSLRDLDNLLSFIERAEDFGINLNEETLELITRIEDEYNKEVLKNGGN